MWLFLVCFVNRIINKMGLHKQSFYYQNNDCIQKQKQTRNKHVFVSLAVVMDMHFAPPHRTASTFITAGVLPFGLCANTSKCQFFYFFSFRLLFILHGTSGWQRWQSVRTHDNCARTTIERGHRALQQQTVRDPKFNNNNKNYLYLATNE
ncbi:unnamed protein product, partial [Polarella glacialis]